MEPVFSEYGKKLLEIKTSKEDIREIGKLKFQDVDVVSGSTIWCPTKEETGYMLKKQVEAAALLGADASLWFPEYGDVIFVETGTGIRYDKAYERCLEALKELGGFGADRKCAFKMKMYGIVFSCLLWRWSLLDEVNSPFVGAYFDVGNVNYQDIQRTGLKF